MGSATQHAATPLAAPRARPGLALVLALLSLPGSTVTWYLIALGGLLIGLPLAIGVLAIVQMAVYYLVESL